LLLAAVAAAAACKTKIESIEARLGFEPGTIGIQTGRITIEATQGALQSHMGFTYMNKRFQ
jgi:hypothetical protein